MIWPIVAAAFMTASPAGHYVLSGVHEVASELLLEPSGSFRYMLIYGAADFTAEGTWKQEGGAVVLTTKMPPEAPFRMLSQNAGEEGELQIKVQNARGNPVPNIDVVVKLGDQSRKSATNGQGIARFDPLPAPGKVRFQIPVYQFESREFEAASGNRRMVFEIHGEAITAVPFREERLTLQGDTLELKFWNPEHPLRYRKHP